MYSFPPPNYYFPPQQAIQMPAPAYVQPQATPQVKQQQANQQYYTLPPNYYLPQTQVAYTQQKQPAQAPSEQKNVTTSIFYFNDIHGRLNGAKKIVSASDNFDKSMSGKQTDALKISAGDICIGAGKEKNTYMLSLLNLMGIDAATLGNHEFDMGTSELANQLKKAPINFTVTNINTDNQNPLNELVNSNKIARSRIIEKNGNKYGFIGTIPTSLKDRLNTVAKETTETMSVDDINETIKEIQQEVDKLKQQGVNKIILSSHMDDEENEKIATQTSGIDVIISGHSHRVLEGVKKDVNLFNAKDGKPVVITQAGKDGLYYGVIDLTFNHLGEIVKVANNVTSTKDIAQSLVAGYFENYYLGKPEVLGKLTNKVEAMSEEELVESPISCLSADALRAKTQSDIAFMNIGGSRGSLGPGDITDRDIRELIPYQNKIKTFKYSEKDLIDILKSGVESHVKGAHGPGPLQASGLRYTIEKDFSIDDVYVENKDGSWTKIDEDHPSETKFYTVAYDSYLESGPKYLEKMNCPDKLVKAYDFDTTTALIEYIKSFQNKPFEIKAPNRITIEK